MATLKSFTQLYAWQKAHSLALKVYRTTANFPKDETFGLTSQARRASVSVSANIAEGFKRIGNADQKRFYNFAAASLEELRAEMLLARDLGYIAEPASDEIFNSISETSGYLASWIRRCR